MLAVEKEATREVRRLRSEQAAADADASLAGAKRVGEAILVQRVFEERGPEYLKAFVERLIAAPGRIALVADRGRGPFQWLIAHSLGDRLELSAAVVKHFGISEAKGGGGGTRMQGIGARPAALEQFLDAVERELTRVLEEERA
jgi:alanyl-tRNA synthetase